MKRSLKCHQFLENQGVESCTIIAENDDGYFRMRGCECCQNGLGNTVFDCSGYDPKTKTVVEIGSVCGDCLQWFYNGENSKVEA